MCMICAAIPAAAAVGTKLNADQLKNPPEQRKPIFKITGMIILLLSITSFLYHTFFWRN